MPPDTPPTPASSSTPIFTISVPDDAKEAEFQGYELYYRFYGSSGEINFNLQNVSEAQLTSVYGYRQVCSGEDEGTSSSQSLHTHKPLIPVPLADRNRAFLITVDFINPLAPMSGQPIVTYDGTVQSISIRRNVEDANTSSSTHGECKPYVPLLVGSDPHAYQETDRDIGVTMWNIVKPDGGTGSVFMAVYALSYGLRDFSTDIYSLPVYLGSIEITTDQ